MSGRGTARLHAAAVSIALGGLLSLGVFAPAHAVPLPEFTGYASDSYQVVNYAVLLPFDSNAGVLASSYVPAEGNSGFDPSKYTYLYQVANVAPSPLPTGSTVTLETFASNAQNSTSVSSTTVGSFASGNFRLDFLNNGSVVNATGNNLQNAGSLGIAARTLTSSEANLINANTPLTGTNVHPVFGFQSSLASGVTSPLFGYQSTVGPTFTFSQTSVLFRSASGDYIGATNSVLVPNAMLGSSGTSTSAPEPSTMLLIGSGALGLLAWQRTKRASGLQNS